MRCSEMSDSRIVVVLEGNGTLPWNWRERVQRMLYRAMGEAGDRLHGGRYSLFTFALKPAAPKAAASGLRSENGLWFLHFASALPEAADAVFGYWRQNGRLEVDGCRLERAAVFREMAPDAEVAVFEPAVVFRRDKSGFLAPGEPGYFEALAGALLARWRYCGGDSLPAEDVKLSFAGPPRRKLEEYCGRQFLCFGGRAVLGAPGELRRFARLVGLGHKPSCGFGYVF